MESLLPHELRSARILGENQGSRVVEIKAAYRVSDPARDSAKVGQSSG